MTMIESAEHVDECIAIPARRLTLIANEARKHGNMARIVGRSHVLAPDGSCLATSSAVKLATWMGF